MMERESGPHIKRFVERAFAGAYGDDMAAMAGAFALWQILFITRKSRSEEDAIRYARKWAGFEPRRRGREVRHESNDPAIRSAGHEITRRYLREKKSQAQAMREIGRLHGGAKDTRTSLLGQYCDEVHSIRYCPPFPRSG